MNLEVYKTNKMKRATNIQEGEEQIFTLSCFLDAKLFILPQIRNL